MWRSPPYERLACFGKTKATKSQRNGTSLRLREEWIGVPVPAIVDEITLCFAQERLRQYKLFTRSGVLLNRALLGIW